MGESSGNKIIFQYQRRQLMPLLYMPFLGVISIAMLHAALPNAYGVERHSYFYALWLVVLTVFSLINYLYMRSYKIAMGEQSLVVSSFIGSKKIFYMRLKRVELAPMGRGDQRYRLAIFNDRGSPEIKINGDKFEMERVAETLKERIRPFV